MSSDVISGNDWALFMRTVGDIWAQSFGFLNDITIAGVPLLSILIGLFGLSLAFVIIHNLSVK